VSTSRLTASTTIRIAVLGVADRGDGDGDGEDRALAGVVGRVGHRDGARQAEDLVGFVREQVERKAALVRERDPVAALQAAPLSDVIVPFPETAVILTGNGFGFETFSFTEPEAPGYRSAVVEALASLKVTAEAVAAFP
jgi:hypothetical protein